MQLKIVAFALNFCYSWRMTKKDKLVNRFKTLSKDFTWDELCALLKIFDYKELQQGKTSGSRVRFVHKEFPPIMLHKPHPTRILKHYQLREIYNMLLTEGIL